MTLRDRVELFRAFGREAATSLKPLGFARGRGQLLASPVSDQVWAIVGLNKAIEADHVEVNPVMGLRHEAIQSLIRESLGLPELAVYSMTMSASLGYLMPEPRYRPVIVTSDLRQAANDLAVDVERYGLPFVRKHKELAEIAEAVQSPPFNGEHIRVYGLPAAYFLIGDYSAMEDVLKEHLKDLAGKIYPAAVQYRQFARVLRARATALRQKG